MTYSEWLALRISLFVLSENKKRYNCDHCLRKKFPGEPKRLEKERIALACRETRDKPFLDVYLSREITFKFATCPGNVFLPVTLDYLSMYNAYQKGILPFPGSYAEQPNKIFEVFGIIETHNQMIEERQIREMNRKQKKELAKHG